jgi:peptidoglycan hydrolase-like protein with peptidoglycan-binding domain
VPLISNLFKDCQPLQDCLVRDSAHVTRGAVGDHVARIHLALADLGAPAVDAAEVAGRRYGPSTAAAVLAFKKARKIVNRAYQTSEDDVVGKMTVAALDRELFDKQYVPGPSRRVWCPRAAPAVPPPGVRPRGPDARRGAG